MNTYLPLHKKLQLSNSLRNPFKIEMDIAESIEKILNNLQASYPWPKCFSEFEESIFNYGINTNSNILCDLNLNTTTLCQAIRKNILSSEPRLQELEVIVQEIEEHRTESIKLNIYLKLHDHFYNSVLHLIFDWNIAHSQFLINPYHD